MIVNDKIKRAVLRAGVAATVFLGYANIGETSPTVGVEHFSDNAIIQQADNSMAAVQASVSCDEKFFDSVEYKESIKGVQYTEMDLKAAPYLENWHGYMDTVVNKDAAKMVKVIEARLIESKQAENTKSAKTNIVENVRNGKSEKGNEDR